MSDKKKLKARKTVLENELAEIEEILDGIETNNLLSEDTRFNLKTALEEVSNDMVQELEEIDFDMERWEVVSGDEG